MKDLMNRFGFQINPKIKDKLEWEQDNTVKSEKNVMLSYDLKNEK